MALSVYIEAFPKAPRGGRSPCPLRGRVRKKPNVRRAKKKGPRLRNDHLPFFLKDLAHF
jgi:hypothetical protein